MYICRLDLTIHIVDLEEEPEFVRLTAMDQEVKSFEQLIQSDGAAAVRIKECKETLGEERLYTKHKPQQIYYIMQHDLSLCPPICVSPSIIGASFRFWCSADDT